MIELNNLTYSYRKEGAAAVSDATTSIAPGIYLLLGENGAGKTTLLHLIAGLLTPRAGAVTVDGAVPSMRRPSLMSRMFFLSDSFECPFESVNMFARCHAPFYPGFSAECLAENLAAFGMNGNERLKDMSLGARRKAYIAYSLSLGVDVLLLDEPANGLDIGSKKELRRMLGRCVGEEQTVIISTHTVADLQPLYDGLILMSHSKLLFSSPGWMITERLRFVSSMSPVAGALYQEPEAGLFRAILVNEGGVESDINYSLLYSAVMSDSREAILSVLRPCSTISVKSEVGSR